MRLGKHGEWASGLVYGGNQHVLPGGASGSWEHSVIAESNLQLDAANSVFGRAEYVRKSGEELALPAPLTADEFDIGMLALGYVREVAGYRGATLGIGARAAINLVPQSLESEYGSRTPLGIAVFLRLRPALLEGAHTMDPEMHHASASKS